MNDGWMLLIVMLAAINVTLIVALLLYLPKSWRSAEQVLRDELRAGRVEAQTTAAQLRQEIGERLKCLSEDQKDLTDSNREALDRIRTTVDERVKELQEGNEKKVGQMRQEITEGLKSVSEAVSARLAEMGQTQQAELQSMTRQLKELTDSNREALTCIRDTVDARLKELQEGNERKLEQMRQVVDEKLHETIEKRLSESFKLVSERLEAVHQGLGEMQNLATGVGDLKRVLTNVKARGTWAEVQLGALLEHILAPGQYEKNVRVNPESSEVVEYAIALPGPKGEGKGRVWLPIDSKFPQEDYIRLQEAADRGDSEAVQRATESLARTARMAAKDMRDKYICPPGTTDFAIMFLATEGLYAEVIRQPALVEDLLQNHRVVVAGPTTLAAILSSLRMGFQAFAIERRAAEVWKVLGAVKTEFRKFGTFLEKVKRQLDTASRTLEQTDVRTRAMESKLRSVEQMPDEEAKRILELPASSAETDSGLANQDAALPGGRI